MLRKKIFLVSNIQIETVYRLYCLQQLFQKRPNQAIFSSTNLHNVALMKNLAKIQQEVLLQKNHFWSQECKSRQPIDCTF